MNPKLLRNLQSEVAKLRKMTKPKSNLPDISYCINQGWVSLKPKPKSSPATLAQAKSRYLIRRNKFFAQGLTARGTPRLQPWSNQNGLSISNESAYKRLYRAKLTAKGLTTEGTPRKRPYSNQNGISQSNPAAYMRLYRAQKLCTPGPLTPAAPSPAQPAEP